MSLNKPVKDWDTNDTTKWILSFGSDYGILKKMIIDDIAMDGESLLELTFDEWNDMITDDINNKDIKKKLNILRKDFYKKAGKNPNDNNTSNNDDNKSNNNSNDIKKSNKSSGKDGDKLKNDIKKLKKKVDKQDKIILDLRVQNKDFEEKIMELATKVIEQQNIISVIAKKLNLPVNNIGNNDNMDDVEAYIVSYCWQWDNNGIWTDYDLMTSNDIERQHNNNVSKYKFTITNNSNQTQNYEINFDTNMQENLKTKKKRNVRRIKNDNNNLGGGMRIIGWKWKQNDLYNIANGLCIHKNDSRSFGCAMYGDFISKNNIELFECNIVINDTSVSYGDHYAIGFITKNFNDWNVNTYIQGNNASILFYNGGYIVKSYEFNCEYKHGGIVFKDWLIKGDEIKISIDMNTGIAQITNLDTNKTVKTSVPDNIGIVLHMGGNNSYKFTVKHAAVKYVNN